jgi:hypothetical protein
MYCDKDGYWIYETSLCNLSSRSTTIKLEMFERTTNKINYSRRNNIYLFIFYMHFNEKIIPKTIKTKKKNIYFLPYDIDEH